MRTLDQIKGLWKDYMLDSIDNDGKANAPNKWDMAQFCLLRAFHSESEHKVTLAKYLLAKTFTPSKGLFPYEALEDVLTWIIADVTRSRTLGWDHMCRTSLFGYYTFADIFDDEEEMKSYIKFLMNFKYLNEIDLNRNYCYIFIDDTDVTPEQIMVQAAHATMVVGKAMNSSVDPNNVYYQIVYKPHDMSWYDLQQKYCHLEFETFVEPDLGYRVIAAATHPFPWTKRGDMIRYPLVTFYQQNPLGCEGLRNGHLTV